MIWDLESKSVVEELKPSEGQGKKNDYCLSLAWSADGRNFVWWIYRQQYFPLSRFN